MRTKYEEAGYKSEDRDCNFQNRKAGRMNFKIGIKSPR